MELHAFNIELPMTKTHDQTVLGLRGDLKTIGNAVALHDKRVIARGFERIGKAREHALAFV